MWTKPGSSVMCLQQNKTYFWCHVNLLDFNEKDKWDWGKEKEKEKLVKLGGKNIGKENGNEYCCEGGEWDI